jgi:hypothetical protein
MYITWALIASPYIRIYHLQLKQKQTSIVRIMPKDLLTQTKQSYLRLYKPATEAQQKQHFGIKKNRKKKLVKGAVAGTPSETLQR